MIASYDLKLELSAQTLTHTVCTHRPSGWRLSAVARLEAEVSFQGGRQWQVFHVLTIKVLSDDKTTQVL